MTKRRNEESLVIRRDSSVYSFLSRVKTSDDRRGTADRRERENDLSDRTIDQFSQEGWLIDERVDRGSVRYITNRYSNGKPLANTHGERNFFPLCIGCETGHYTFFFLHHVILRFSS